MKPFIYLPILTLLLINQAQISGASSAVGLTLMENSSARASSLGEAFSAVTDDMGTFAYNPASLSTLKMGQASFLFEKGLLGDSYGHFTIGSPLANDQGIGLSLGYYNAGSFNIYEEGRARSANLQRDLTLSLGYARPLGRMSFGIAGKYLSSELAEQFAAHAYAADMGLSLPVGEMINTSFAIQNMGTQLKYNSQGEDLPLTARVGMALTSKLGKTRALYLLEIPYRIHEANVTPAVGMELGIGPLALRAGYKVDKAQNEFSVGIGFGIGQMNLDYAFGLVKELSAQHKVSLATKFGGINSRSTSAPFVRNTSPKPAVKKVETVKREPIQRQSLESISRKPYAVFTETSDKKWETYSKRRLYVIRKGDSWGSIAKKMYGTSQLWEQIAIANKHLLSNNQELEIGTKIVIP